MPLFQQSVIKKHIESFNAQHIEEKWQLFKAIFHSEEKQQNIRNSKEEQYQEGFLRDLFVGVFGYIINPEPNFNLLTEQKNVNNSKKADGAIVIDGKAVAVIELKGTETTDLNKIEAQAFGYKSNQPGCNYVIVSNFEKLRFYIDNTTQQEEFNLFTLTKPQFEVLYACLSWESISKNTPMQILNESVSKESVITHKLYKDYSEFKRALFANLVELNPQFDKLLLFKKTQKLLDRFLFVFFAEDRLLLPTNLIFRINKEWENIIAQRIQVSLYDRYKMYFNDLNVGAKVTLPAFGKKTGEAITAEFQIFAYNGGLFQPDEVLDQVKVDDSVLFTYTERLSHYNFESDVDVNILGHIFENSLNEIDEIKSEIEGNTLDKTKTRRKKDGVFYTPKYITKYIVENTVGKLCSEKKVALKLNDEDYITDKKLQTKTKKALLDKLANYRNWLLDLTICDPACGSGAFLNQALEFLIAEHRYIDELQAKLLGDSLVLSDIENSILERNIYGVDLNDESVEIAKLSLWLRTAQKGRKLNSLNNNIKCGNSLIDDPAVAGDKAFKWEEEFPEVFKEGGFDVVIGNPPYVVYIKSIFGKATVNYVNKRFLYAEYNPNTYALFTELSLSKLIKQDGYLGFIIPNSWLEGQYFSKMRNNLYSKKVEEIVYLRDTAFNEVVETVVLHVRNNMKIYREIRLTSDILDNISTLENLDTVKYIKGFNPFTTNLNPILHKLENEYSRLGEHAIVYRGLETRNNKLWLSETKDSDNHIPILLGKDINRYGLFYSGTYVNFIPKEMKSNANINMYNQPKILMRRTGSSIIANLDEKNFMALKNLYLIIPNDVKNIYSLLAQLNSHLLAYYHKSKTGGENKAFAQFKGTYIADFPVQFKIEIDFESVIKKRIEVDNDFSSTIAAFGKYLIHKLRFVDLTNKLQNWHELEFGNFIKELNKAIKTAGGHHLLNFKKWNGWKCLTRRKKKRWS